MIKQLLQEILKDSEEMYSKVCLVDEVNGLVCDASPVDGSAKIFDIRLTANPESINYYAVIPKVGSMIVATFLTQAVAFASLVDDPDRLVFVQGTVRFEVSSAGFLIKRGSEDLFKLIADLIEAAKAEKHGTPSGPTTGLLPTSTLAYDNVKIRFKNLLKEP